MLRSGNGGEYSEENGQAEKKNGNGSKNCGQGGSYSRERMPRWPHEATGRHKNPHFYIHA